LSVDDRARFLWVEVLHQFGRAVDVGEQRRDRLALTLDRYGRIRLGRRNANLESRRCGLK
jgi:hypothetical protein